MNKPYLCVLCAFAGNDLSRKGAKSAKETIYLFLLLIHITYHL